MILGHGRDPDDLPRPAARAAVRRPAHGAAALAPAGRDRGRGADDPLDGRPHLQGRDREGGDRERGRGGDPELGAEAGLRRATQEALAGREAVRRVGLHELPHLPRHGRLEPRRARPLGRGREGQGRPVPDRPPQVPELRQPGLADAAVRRRSARTTCTSSPSSSRPPRVRSRLAPCASSSASPARRERRTRPGCWRRSPAPAARSASAPRAPGSRCSRPSSTATRGSRTTRRSRG